MCRMRHTLSNCDSWAQRIDQITIMLSRLWICNAIMQSCQASLDTIIIIIWPKIHTYLYWCSSAMVCVIFSGIITNDMIINISLMFLSSSSRSYSQWCGSPMASVSWPSARFRNFCRLMAVHTPLPKHSYFSAYVKMILYSIKHYETMSSCQQKDLWTVICAIVK